MLLTTLKLCVAHDCYGYFYTIHTSLLWFMVIYVPYTYRYGYLCIIHISLCVCTIHILYYTHIFMFILVPYTHFYRYLCTIHISLGLIIYHTHAFMLIYEPYTHPSVSISGSVCSSQSSCLSFYPVFLFWLYLFRCLFSGCLVYLGGKPTNSCFIDFSQTLEWINKNTHTRSYTYMAVKDTHILSYMHKRTCTHTCTHLFIVKVVHACTCTHAHLSVCKTYMHDYYTKNYMCL